MSIREVKKKIVIHAIFGVILSMIAFHLFVSVICGVNETSAYVANLGSVFGAYLLSYHVFTVIPDKYDVKLESAFAVIATCLSAIIALVDYAL